MIVEILALFFFYGLKKDFGHKGEKEGYGSKSTRMRKSLGREGVLLEIERLRTGGEMDETLIRKMSPEDKAIFEVGLIDALTKWPREDQHRLRSTLIKNGYDERCARCLMRGDISNRVRASTLLALLRPQVPARPHDSDRFKRTHSGRLVPIVTNDADEL
ncbi:MAG: hypothetical protein L0229_02630 [Blastocatellia bacterium]|nr:hypothetical protein [Blastocatellia bacterium]